MLMRTNACVSLLSSKVLIARFSNLTEWLAGNVSAVSLVLLSQFCCDAGCDADTLGCRKVHVV